MAVKMILLKTGETLITDAQEVVQDEKVKGYLFKQPQIVRTQEKTMLMEEDTKNSNYELDVILTCLLYTSPSPRDATLSRMPSSA